MRRMALLTPLLLLAFPVGCQMYNTDTTLPLYIVLFLIPALLLFVAVLFLHKKNKELRKCLSEHTTVLNSIYNSTPSIVFCMNTNLEYTDCNKNFETFVKLPKSEILGKTDSELFKGQGKLAEAFTEANEKIIYTGVTIKSQDIIQNQNGTDSYYDTIKTPLIEDGRITGLICISRDITALKIAEAEAREASMAKSQFLANMSHEIRTPMNAIIGMSDLLLNETLTKRQKEYVNDINVSSHSLLGIINDILDLSKIEAGKLELSPIDYDFRTLVDNIRSMFEYVTYKKDLEFKYEEVGKAPRCLYGDDIRLRQILTNICGNAVKFTSKGFIKLTVTTDEDEISFEIKDTGMGIKKEEIPSLFEAFSQADTRKNRNITGTGLGLSISKTFAEMMGGNISVASEYGEGTVFTVTIPKIMGNPDAIKNEIAEDSFTAPTAKVLLVDDNELNLKVASGLLHVYKITAKMVLSGKEAIRAVSEADYDIVFMDHMMPEMDGIEATAQIRKLGDKYKDLTIIALTANAIQGAKEMFLSNGLNGFISKPIENDELASTLKKWLPPEKIEEPQDVPKKIDGETAKLGFLDSIKKVNGINTKIGLSRFFNLEDMYRETVELFHKKLLIECDKMDNFLQKEDYRNLAISVHAMKSSLSTIGAMDLSEKASVLEKASKNSESEYCQEYFPLFLEKLRVMNQQLTEIMPKEEKVIALEKGDSKYLADTVKAVLAAADDFDGDKAVGEIKKLLNYDFGSQNNTIIKEAHSAFKDFDFDGAIDKLNKITVD